MEFDEYQLKVAETAIYPDAGSGNIQALMYCAGSATGEAGEVWGQVKKAYRDDLGMVTDVRREKIEKEIGDTLWYLAQLCNELEINGGRLMRENLEKLQRRKETGTLGGDGDDREKFVESGHFVEVRTGRLWVQHPPNCTFERHSCPFTLAAEVENGRVAKERGYFSEEEALWEVVLDERGELIYSHLLRVSPQPREDYSEGWEFTFIPAKGVKAGTEITRIFWHHSEEEAVNVCLGAYGEGTWIKEAKRIN